MDVPTSDIVVLQLDAVERPDEEAAVVEEMTFPGLMRTLADSGSISERVDLLAELESLAGTGLVERVVLPVAGSEGERTAYRLTDAGRDRAATVRERLQDETVEVTNGGTERVRLGEMDRYFDDQPLVTALARLTEDGQVPVDSFQGEDLVGRSAALDRLESAVTDLQTKGGHAVVVTGEAGVGKTTLVEAFLDNREQTVVTGMSRCHREGSRPYGVFRELFEDLPGVPGIDRLVGDLPGAGGDDETVEEQRRLAFADVGDALRDLAEDREVVVVLEDLQWADEPSLELLQYLVETVGTLVNQVLFVGTIRTDSDHPDVPEQLATIVGDTHHEHLPLEPLDARDLRRVLQATLGRTDVPVPVAESIHDLTGGNPLFAIETAWLLQERGLVDPATGTYPSEADLKSLPDSISGVALERLDSLDAGAWEVLELGAVVGERIPRVLLVAASDRAEPELLEYVDLLVETGVWAASGAHLRFVHTAIRETVLDGMPAERRRALHEAVVAAIEADSTPEGAAPYERLATHYRRAGAVAAAIDASLSAADRAREMYAHERAVDAGRQAINLAREVDDPDALVEALELVGETYLVTGQFTRARERFRQVRERTEDPERRHRMLVSKGEAHKRAGEFDEARDLYRQALADATERGDRAGEATVRQHLASVAIKLGEFSSARDSLQRSLALSRELGDRGKEADALNELGIVARKEGDYASARENYRAALDIFRDLDDHYRVAKTRTNLGVVDSRVGDLERAQTNYRRARQIFSDCGDRHREATVRQNLGILAAKQADFEAAREHFEAARERFGELGDGYRLARVRNNLGLVDRKAGSPERARGHFREALETFRVQDDRLSEAKCRSNLGIIARRRGDLDAAREYHERSLDLARETGAGEPIAQSLGYLGALEIAEGNVAAGRQKLDEALATLLDNEAVPVALEVLRQHLETERDADNVDRALDLCGTVDSLVDRAESPLGHERARIETVCEDLRAG